MRQSPSSGPEPFIERLQSIAAESATRLAVVYPRSVTYGDLLGAATQVARGLSGRGLAPGAPVPVWTACPIDGVTASLGIALAGGAFVPIDPRAPLARARFVVDDCQPLVTIADQDHALLLSGHASGEVLTTERLASQAGEGTGVMTVPAEQPACIIYTSGSTGRPKGVVLTHANLASMLGLRRAVHGPASRVLPIHPCSFDAFQGAVLWSLSSGGALALLEGEQILDPEAIAGVIERHGVATISVVPSMYQALLRTTDPGRLASLRSAILGGEVMTPELAALHFSQLRGAALFNEYGPTECSVFSTVYRVPEFPPTPIPIGAPAGDVDCQVVDAAGAPCGPMQEGELYIGGAGVARGYWRQDDLTAERFVTSPGLANGARLYRTGDRVRWNPRGELEFLGRIDDQIKLRGNRIEPGEIESAICMLPGVLAAAVVLRDGRDDGVGGQSGPRLAAFYVTENGTSLVEPRQRLTEHLPSYMLPSLFVRLDALPTLSNGKIDRRALAQLPLAEEAPAGGAPELTAGERQVAEIWARVLGVPVESIGRDSDFFGLGGHSLLVTAVRGALARELGRAAPEEVFFTRSCLSDLARALLPVVSADDITATGSTPASVLPLAPVQETFYTLAQIEPDSAAYVVPATLKISGPLDGARLRAAALAVVRDNESLRARVERRGDQAALVIAPPEDEASWFRWEQRDVAAGPDLDAAIRSFEVAPIDIAGPALARFQLLRVSDDEHYLTLAAHHIVVDGASVGLIAAELLANYRGAARLVKVKAPYATFVAASRARLTGERLERLNTFWREHLRGAAAPALPHDYLPGQGTRQADAATSVVRPLSAALAARVHACARRLRVTPFVTALGAVAVTLGRWLPDRALILGSPVSLRGIGPFEGTIGCMVNSVAIKLALGSDRQTFAELLGGVRASVLESMRHAELPIAWLHTRPGRGRGDAAVPMFRTFFNYLDRGADHLQAGALRFEPRFALRPVPKFELTVYVHDWGQRMDLELVYPPDRYDPRTMDALARQIEEVLDQVTQAPERPLDAIRLDRQPVATAPSPPPAFDASATIHAAFAVNARVRPAELATADERGPLTYRELAARAGQVTAALEMSGLRAGSRVAIAGSRDAWFVACVVGALEAGCVFTVLDPGAPPAVRQAVLDVFKPDLTLDPHGQLEDPRAARVQSGTGVFGAPGRAPRPLARLSGEGDAYALFTSGTSSRKKGILGTHAPVVRFLAWQARTFRFGEQDRFALLAGLGHDPMLRDLFAPLSCGGSLYIPTQATRDDPRLLAAFLNANRVTVLHITPPLAANLIAVGEKLSAPRLIFCGGDRLPAEQAQRLLEMAPNASLVNGYGLTETPQIIVCHEVERGVPLASIPIGVPVTGARVDVEAEDGRPCAVGELGEIVVHGDHVAKGMLTDQGVVPLAGEHGLRSGDVGRRDAWGRIHCLGRRDRERKIRGFRVPLDEVEEALRGVSGVERARAVVRTDGGSDRLVAFVVADRARTSEPRIRTALAARMQAAAVPDQVVILEALPVSVNGKVDDAALAEWDLSAVPNGRPPAIEARTQTEDLIIRVWQDVLGLSAVGITDDFFDLGGDSIRAVAALSRLSGELGMPIAVEVLVRNPTPAALASTLLARARHLEEPLVVKVNASGSRPPLWMFHPIGGHVLFIRRLAAELGADQPVFGVQARGLDGVRPPIDSMAELVALYSELVRQHQEHGPYFLGGPSFGGRIAFEVAQHLRQEGEQIAMIAMFDSYAPGFPVLAPHHRLWSLLERHRRRWPRLIPERPLAAVREWWGGPSHAPGQGRDPAHHPGVDYLDDLDPNRGALERHVRAVVAANQRAAKSRPTAYYPGCVTLFRAELQPVEDFRADFSDVRNGWGKYAREVTVDIVNGTHHRIMDFPALGQLVTLFKARLDQRRASGGAVQ